MRPHTELDDLSVFKNYKKILVSTHGHDRPLPKGGIWDEMTKKGVQHRDNVALKVDDKYVFPEMTGPGKIINMWFTCTPAVPYEKGEDPAIDFLDRKKARKIVMKNKKGYLKMVLRTIKGNDKPIAHKKIILKIYFDDESEPSVDCPLGDFFGTGFGKYKHYWSRYLNTTSGGYVCNFHMPFKKKARVEIVNTSKTHAVIAFYGAITYVHYDSEESINSMAYFHAKYHEEHPTTPDKPFLFLDTMNKEFKGKEGAGHLVGVVLSARPLNPKKDGFGYLEGNTKIFIDGEENPSIEYTGTEDIFQGAWYYQKGVKRRQTEFHTPYHGVNFISQNKRGLIGQALWSKYTFCKSSQYRFFPEGIPFEKSMKVILHHGEFDEIPGEYDGVVYWYQSP